MGLWGKGKESGRSGQTSVAIAAPAAQGAKGPGHGLRNWRCPEAAARGGRLEMRSGWPDHVEET